MNVTKIILTRCQFFYLKCTKFNFGLGSAQTPLEQLTALLRTRRPRPIWIWRGNEKGDGNEGKRTDKGKRGDSGKGKGRGRKGMEFFWPILLIFPACALYLATEKSRSPGPYQKSWLRLCYLERRMFFCTGAFLKVSLVPTV